MTQEAKKYLVYAVASLWFIAVQAQQNVGIGTTTPASSAQLDISSTTKGLLIPRLTSAQRTAIASPANGLLVYDTNTNSFWFYKSPAWVEISTGSVGANSWSVNGNDINNTNSGSVGIGTSSPVATAKATIQTADYSTALVIRNSSGSAALNAFVGGPANGNAISLGTTGAMPLALYTNSANRIFINANGNIGIGTESAGSKLQVNGSMSLPIRTVNTTGLFAITDDDYTLVADCQYSASNDISLVLPAAIGRKGRIYNIVMINYVTMLPDGSGIVKIYHNDLSYFTDLYHLYESTPGFRRTGNRTTITLQSDGVNWLMISSNYSYYEDHF